MDQIVKLIKIIANQIDIKMQTLTSSFDLTSTQVRVLNYLYHNDCKNQKQLCDTFKLTSATVNGILDRLEDKGYILREKLEDKRNNKIVLTEAALELTHDFEKTIEYNNMVLAKDVTPEEQEELTHLLSKVLKNIEEGNYDKNTCR